MSEARGSGFGPTVLAGLATSGLAAVASVRTWYAVPTADRGPAFAPLDALPAAAGTGEYPAAAAASLVLLASWGVLLVTRGRLRRFFAVVAAVAAVAALGTVIAGYLALRGSEVEGFDQMMGRAAGEPEFTGWFWTAAVAALLALPPALVAVRRVGAWPEMGERYDAPAGRRKGAADEPPAAAPEDAAGRAARDAWRDLDEGRDPTDPD